MTQLYRKLIPLLATGAAIAAAGLPAAQARQGADDPAGHNAGDDNGGLVAKQARQGADDPANHDANDDRKARDARVRHRARRHAHASRHGADDGPNHDARDDRGSR